MPLVERYHDWNIADGPFDDPHTLEFDHRIEADVASLGPGLANVEDNIKATCIITVLKSEFGWTNVGNSWVYDPTHKQTDLSSIWRNNLVDSVQYDKDSLKNCFCDSTTNSATGYVGPELENLSEKIDTLDWPRDTTEFVSRFAPEGQYMIGPKFCTAYHLGDGYVGTAGHCLDMALVDSQLGELRVVFNWVGDVVSKKTFTESEVFMIERVILCDTHGPAPSPTDSVETALWSKRWDSAILKLIGTPNQLSPLKSANYATRPPDFGSPVSNIGCPLGTQLKVSTSAHILRRSRVGDDQNPFSHLIAPGGTFTTDLDQFEGNSGGPVYDANTGYIVGHTSSTQDAVAESDAAAIESWAREYAKHSKNYTIAAEINAILQKQQPNNDFYRVHPKFLRTLTGKPRDSPLMKCVTNICPGDLGPNKELQPAGGYQAVFSRHHFDSKDVYLRNATGRVDRNAIFMTPLNVLLGDYDACILTIRLAGKVEAFTRPGAGSSVIIAVGAVEWVIHNPDFHKSSSATIPPGIDAWSATFDLVAQKHDIPPGCLDAPRGLTAWTAIRLEQPTRNPPSIVGLSISIKRLSFPFPVNQTWPPDRPDVTNNPKDAELRWPEETFEFATTAGDTSGASQTDGHPEKFEEGRYSQDLWRWEAPINRVWTNPRQPSQGLRDPLMDSIDQLLA